MIAYKMWAIGETTCVPYGKCHSRALAHWGRDKMAVISQTTFSFAVSWMKMHEFWFKISLKFVPKVRINNIPALVQIMAWRRHYLNKWWYVLLTYICVIRPQWVKRCENGMKAFDNSLVGLYWYRYNVTGVVWRLAIKIIYSRPRTWP